MPEKIGNNWYSPRDKPRNLFHGKRRGIEPVRNNFWNELATHWQFWIAALTSVIYLIGYLNGLLLLRSFQSKSAPTEIYSVGSLFVWGTTFFITSLIVPSIIAVLLLILNYYGFFRNRMRIYIFLFIAFLLIFISLPAIAIINPIGFQLLPSTEYLGSLFLLRLFTTVSICFLGYAILRLKNEPLHTNNILLLLATVFVWNIVLLTGISRNALDVTAGAPPGLYSQDPSIPGALITRNRISNLGSEAPEYGNDAFETWGLLLNRRDGAYYFYPGIYAQDSLKSGLQESIVIVPESEVIVFISHGPCSNCP
jgi:hypothetical protein